MGRKVIVLETTDRVLDKPRKCDKQNNRIGSAIL